MTAQTCAGGEVERLAPAQLEALGVVVDLRHADEQELQSLPGVGPVLAGRIVEARPFVDIEDLRRVRGIGPHRLERVRARVSLSGERRRPRRRAPPPSWARPR